MKIHELAARIQTILERSSMPGIDLWGWAAEELQRELGGEVLQIAPYEGCDSETCQHVSHDPAAPVLRWTPPTGSMLRHLGHVDRGESLYAVQNGDEVTLIWVTSDGRYHDEVRIVQPEEVPAHFWKETILQE